MTTQANNTRQIVAIYNAGATTQLQDIKVINGLKLKLTKMTKADKIARLKSEITALCDAYYTTYNVDVRPNY